VTQERPRRLLIASRNLFLLRAHHEDTIVALAHAGVEVSVRYENEKQLREDDYRESLRRRGCEVRVSPLPRNLNPSRRGGRPGDLLAFRLRQLVNLLRYYHPDYRGRDWVRERWFPRTAPGPRRLAKHIGRLGSRAALLALAAASRVERLLPPSAPARALLAEERPDAVVTVAMFRNPELVDVLKAAAWEGIPTATWIQSWDNLSSKGLLHIAPDRVFVWNETQRDELLRYHGIPPERAVVTGAQSFDHWFDGEDPSDRARFCSENGIDPERPIVLYLASSRWLEPPIELFFLRWLDAVRSSGDPVLEEAFVLVRPYPQDIEHWSGVDARDSRLSVSPSASEGPMIHSPAFRQRYRDELHHASVAVGLNTTAMIDAAIFGKPVCTVELPELSPRQRGTVHFEYLTTAGGGLLRTAASFDEHVRTLGELIRRDPYAQDEWSARFVEAFVRPHGVDVEPNAVFLDGMLRLLEEPSRRRAPNRAARALGRLIHRAAPVLGAPFEEGHRFPLLTHMLPRSVRARVKTVRHVVLIVLPLGVRARLRRLGRRRGAAVTRRWRNGRSLGS
jgi:hypothetical protein